MDPLSQVVGVLRPQALTWRLLETQTPLALAFSAVEAVVFGQLLQGDCRIERADGVTLELSTGDFMLMARPPSWLMRSGGDSEPVEFKTMLAELERAPARDPTLRLLAGHFVYAPEAGELLAGLMAPVVHVRATEVAAGRLGGTLQLLGEEALARRPGRSLILERLLEVILVEALRHRSAGLGELRPGLLAGLADGRIGRALHALHAAPERPWTVATLAREAGMSRAAFAARFVEVVGASPIGYLAGWRMTLAKSALAASQRPLAEIAELAGYGSVSAFSTAFARMTGASPTRFSRAAAVSGEGASAPVALEGA